MWKKLKSLKKEPKKFSLKANVYSVNERKREKRYQVH